MRSPRGGDKGGDLAGEPGERERGERERGERDRRLDLEPPP